MEDFFIVCFIILVELVREKRYGCLTAIGVVFFIIWLVAELAY